MGTNLNDDINLDQFIVDNNADSTTVGAFISEWCKIAASLDIATGYFDTKAFDSLAPGWESIQKIRLLMGAEVTSGVRSDILKAVRARVLNELEDALDKLHQEDPLMANPTKVQQASGDGKIYPKVSVKTKFHAKAYLTTGTEAFPTKRALVGSSNFTHAGLNRNLELNVQIDDEARINELSEWFENRWAEAEELKEELLEVLRRHTREVTPFEIYGKALTAYFANEQQTTNEWEETKSKIFPLLDNYQKEGYWQLVNIAKRFNGALLCDGVGLGKTYIGLMLIERLVDREGKNVILLAPKSVKEGVWTEELAAKLPALSGKDKYQDFSNLTVLSHSDLRKNNSERIRRLIERADAIVIDEAHHFRNDGYFKDSLGVPSVQGEMSRIEREINSRMARFEAGEPVDAKVDEIYTGSLFENLVVQRSRKYALESQRKQYGRNHTLIFPKKEVPRVADYSLALTYGELFQIFEEAMDKKTRRANGEQVDEPLFRLPIYSQVDYVLPGVALEDFEKGRRMQIVELIRISFMMRKTLKRKTKTSWIR